MATGNTMAGAPISDPGGCSGMESEQKGANRNPASVRLKFGDHAQGPTPHPPPGAPPEPPPDPDLPSPIEEPPDPVPIPRPDPPAPPIGDPPGS